MRQIKEPLCALMLAAIASVSILTGCAPHKAEKSEADSVQGLADEYLKAFL